MMRYPDDAIQEYVSSWWIKDDSKDLRRGRLIKAFVPHVSLVPVTLIPKGRSEPTDHTFVEYKLEPLQIHKKRPSPNYQRQHFLNLKEKYELFIEQKNARC